MQRMQSSLQVALKSNARQDPDGISWISPAQWRAAEWDGVPFNLTGKTKQEICNFLAPPGTSQAIKGLREHFYAINPFKDVTNPTIAEINDWNLEVIRHIRKLFGINIPVKHDARLYLEANWADERKFTTAWNSKYPGPTFPDTPGSTTAGPCVLGDFRLISDHCGASFFPNQLDRQAYIIAAPYEGNFSRYPELNGNGPGAIYPTLTTTGYTERRSVTEGVSGIEASHSWSIKLAQIFKRYICAEGPNGHAGPFLGRTEVGMSWWYEPGQTGDRVHYRGKWAG